MWEGRAGARSVSGLDVFVLCVLKIFSEIKEFHSFHSLFNTNRNIGKKFWLVKKVNLIADYEFYKVWLF